jgi:hypothetical protein
MKALLISLIFVGAAANAAQIIDCTWNNSSPITLTERSNLGFDLANGEQVRLGVTESGNLRVKQQRTAEVILNDKEMNVTYITGFQVQGNQYRLEFKSGDVFRCEKR